MRRVWRLLRYARPYALYSLASVVLMAVVGAMAGLRVLLIKPIIDNVLSPRESPNQVLVFTDPAHAQCRRSAVPHSAPFSQCVDRCCGCAYWFGSH